MEYESYVSFYGPPHRVRERNVLLGRALMPGSVATMQQAEAALDEAMDDAAICTILDPMVRRWRTVKRCRDLIEAILKGEV